MTYCDDSTKASREMQIITIENSMKIDVYISLSSSFIIFKSYESIANSSSTIDSSSFTSSNASHIACYYDGDDDLSDFFLHRFLRTSLCKFKI